MIYARLILSALIAIGGLCALGFGYRLYLRGTGLQQDGTTIHWDKVKISLQTVGAVVMATSCVWAYFAVTSFPKYAQSRDGTISVTVNSGGKSPITVFPATVRGAHLPDAQTPFSIDADLLAKQFRDAIENSPAAFRINAGTQDFKTVSVTVNKENKTLDALFENPNGSIDVIYVPKTTPTGLIFVPTSAQAGDKSSPAPLND